MAISQYPGVGPTNTDVASAVVTAGTAAGFAATGPTTTQIAAAVPTLAQITTAITSNAASAGVTMAAITSTVQANAGSPFGGTYTNLGTTNLPQNATSYTLSGLSGYKYLRIGCSFFLDGTYSPIIRFNSDSGNNYLNTAITYLNNTTTPTRVMAQIQNSFKITYAGNYALNANVRLTGHITISNAASGAYKQVEILLGDSSGTYRFEVSGTYISTSAITSMTITSTEIVGNVGGSLYVIGAN